MLIEMTSEAPKKQRCVLHADFFEDEHLPGEFLKEIQIVSGSQFDVASELFDKKFDESRNFVARKSVIGYLQAAFPAARIRELCD